MSRIITIGTVLLTMALVACSNNEPPPADGGRLPVSTTTKGALIGAVAGGGIGSIGHSTGATIAGAAAGAAMGAWIGHNMEKEKVVEIHQHDSGVRLVHHDKNVTLIMPSDIYFKSDDARIDKKYYPMLDGLAVLLKANPDTFIEVIGYTDNEGNTHANRELGSIRANNVAAYIESQGIDASRIHPVSRGAASPQANNSTKAGRLENRRVEIKLWPVSQRI